MLSIENFKNLTSKEDIKETITMVACPKCKDTIMDKGPKN